MQRTEHGSICSFRGPDLDTVSRDGPWKILANLGCLFKFLTILRQLHEGQKGQVKHNGSLSGSFPISNSVKQGCFLAHTLLTIIDGTSVNAVEHFTYLGDVIPSDATVSKDLDNRLSKASRTFGRLWMRVWQSHLLRPSTNIQIYRAVVVPTLLHGAETWVPYRK